MKKLLTISVIILSLSAVLLGSCSKTGVTKLKVVTSTSLVFYIVQQVGGNHVDAVNLVPESAPR